MPQAHHLVDEDAIEWMSWEADLPLSFDVEHNRDLEIINAPGLNVDVSSLFD